MENKNEKLMKGSGHRVPEREGLQILFITQLRTSLWTAKRLLRVHANMARSASSPNLSSLLREHIVVTEGHLGRLEYVLAKMGKKPRGKKSVGVEALIRESRELMERTQQGALRDAAIIASSLKAAHQLISTYRTLIAFAGTLRRTSSIKVLMQTLTEVLEEERLLVDAACNTVNYDALPESELRRKASHYYRNKNM